MKSIVVREAGMLSTVHTKAKSSLYVVDNTMHCDVLCMYCVDHCLTVPYLFKYLSPTNKYTHTFTTRIQTPLLSKASSNGHWEDTGARNGK